MDGFCQQPKEEFMSKHRIASFALAASLFGTAAVGTISSVSAQQSNRGVATGLVTVLAQIAADRVVTVEVVDSFNNLRVLNNVLSENDIDVTVGDVTILENFLNNNNVTLENFLNNNDITLKDIVAIGVLNTGDIIVFI